MDNPWVGKGSEFLSTDVINLMVKIWLVFDGDSVLGVADLPRLVDAEDSGADDARGVAVEAEGRDPSKTRHTNEQGSCWNFELGVCSGENRRGRNPLAIKHFSGDRATDPGRHRLAGVAHEVWDREQPRP